MSQASSPCHNTFEQLLAFGQVAETKIARWMRSRGTGILPVYAIQEGMQKGPRLYYAARELIVPDLLAFPKGGDDKAIWIESKHKSHFSWRRQRTQQREGQFWCTGVDHRYYLDYLAVMQQTRLPVWLLFLHENAAPRPDDERSGCPATCPTGLFGGPLATLAHRYSHRHPEPSPRMIYWAHDDLTRLATLDEINRVTH